MENTDALFKKAMHLFSEDRYEDARLVLETALQINDRHADTLEALGVIYERLNRPDDAVTLFKKLSHVEPDNLMAHSNLSRIYAKQGKIAEAEAEQAEARRISWKHQLKERQTSQPNFTLKERIDRYKRVIEIAPNDVLGYFSLGSAYIEGGNWIEAETAFRKAISVDPEHSSSYLGLGQALQEQNRVDDAVQIFQTGITISERRGDMIPFKKMSARLKEIRGKK